MALEFITGSEQETKTKTTSTTDKTSNITGNKSGTSSSTTNSDRTTANATSYGKAFENALQQLTKGTSGTFSTREATQKFDTRFLNPEAEKGLTDLLTAGISRLGGDVFSEETKAGAADFLDFANLIKDRAIGSDAFFADRSSAILAEARRQQERAATEQFSTLARNAGSSVGSFVQQETINTRNDLETRLAAAASQLALEARKSGSAELASAADVIGKALGFQSGLEGAEASTDIQTLAALAQIGSTLKGAIKTGTESLSDIFQSFTETEQTVDQKSRGTELGSGTSFTRDIASAVGTQKFDEKFVQDLVEAIKTVTEGESTTEDSGSPLDIVNAVFG